MILINLDLSKIDKKRIKKGKYLDLVCWTYKDGRTDKNGYIGYVKHSLSKEEREASEKSDEFLGSWKDTERQSIPQITNIAAKKAQAAERDIKPEDDEIPF